MKKALAVFARKPELGKGKTRLAHTLGDRVALNVYNDLLAYTCGVTLAVHANPFLFLPTTNTQGEIWARVPFKFREQVAGDLGMKMEAAFVELFALGYENVVLIGSDCPGLTPEIVDDAFARLAHADIVIGPAHDGGYYLLGMRQLHRPIFQNKSWSTEVVFAQTVADIERLKLRFETLPILRDVDTEEDLKIAFSDYFSPELLFVYNADADPISQVFDFAHKILRPSTYACDLCSLTYGNFTMEAKWKSYLKNIPGSQQFIYRDQFEAKFKEPITAPAIIKVVKGYWYVLVSADEIAGCSSLDKLIDLMSERIPQVKP